MVLIKIDEVRALKEKTLLLIVKECQRMKLHQQSPSRRVAVQLLGNCSNTLQCLLEPQDCASGVKANTVGY